MPIKERIIKELQSGPKKYKALKTKFKATKKFFAAMEEFHLSCHQKLLKLPQMEHILQHRITSILMQEQQQHYC